MSKLEKISTIKNKDQQYKELVKYLNNETKFMKSFLQLIDNILENQQYDLFIKRLI